MKFTIRWARSVSVIFVNDVLSLVTNLILQHVKLHLSKRRSVRIPQTSSASEIAVLFLKVKLGTTGSNKIIIYSWRSHFDNTNNDYRPVYTCIITAVIFLVNVSPFIISTKSIRVLKKLKRTQFWNFVYGILCAVNTHRSSPLYVGVAFKSFSIGLVGKTITSLKSYAVTNFPFGHSASRCVPLENTPIRYDAAAQTIKQTVFYFYFLSLLIYYCC